MLWFQCFVTDWSRFIIDKITFFWNLFPACLFQVCDPKTVQSNTARQLEYPRNDRNHFSWQVYSILKKNPHFWLSRHVICIISPPPPPPLAAHRVFIVPTLPWYKRLWGKGKTGKYFSLRLLTIYFSNTVYNAWITLALLLWFDNVLCCNCVLIRRPCLKYY